MEINIGKRFFYPALTDAFQEQECKHMKHIDYQSPFIHQQANCSFFQKYKNIPSNLNSVLQLYEKPEFEEPNQQIEDKNQMNDPEVFKSNEQQQQQHYELIPSFVEVILRSLQQAFNVSHAKELLATNFIEFEGKLTNQCKDEKSDILEKQNKILKSAFLKQNNQLSVQKIRILLLFVQNLNKKQQQQAKIIAETQKQFTEERKKYIELMLLINNSK